jgi:outer membrane receptor protein involved in Fe transport
VGAFPAVVNGKRARSRGIDLDARLRLFDPLTLSATYSYNQSELLDPILVGGVSYGAQGARLPGTPQDTLSVGVDYDRQIASELDLNLHADVSYRSGMTTSLTPSLNIDLPGFAMLNLSAGVNRGPWRTAVFVDNVTNERGVLSANAIGPYDARSIDNRLQRPLTAGLRIGYKFQ